MSNLDLLIKDFNKKYKETIVSVGIPQKRLDKIPFTSPRANYMLYGGLPRGRLIEFAGEEGSGKTTTALDIVANVQRIFSDEHEKEISFLQSIEKRSKDAESRLQYLLARGKKRIIYADCENTLDEEWAISLGVSVDEMIILKPMTQTAEQIFEMLLQMIETDEVGLIVLDSLGVMLSSQAYEKTMEERTYGGIAMALTLFSKKAELLCNKFDCTLIGINQMREDLNSSYGGQTTTGGKAWKHNCSVRLLFQKGSFIDDEGNEIKRSSETPAGNLVLISVTKTKVCKPDRRTGFYTLRYNSGIDLFADVFDMAIRFALIQQAGSWFTFVDENGEILSNSENEVLKFHGKTSVIEFLQQNESFFATLRKAVEKVFGG